MQAIILAAGMGKRLKHLTHSNTKCMVEVNGVTLIERMLRQLDSLALSKITIVIGYEGQKLVDYISTLNIKTELEYIVNDIYYKTNNIFSLSLAKEVLIKEDTLLLESDLIFDDSVLDKIVSDKRETLALVDKYESWMDGTVVKIDDDDNILQFVPGKKFEFNDIPSYYKTVNIYKFSKEFSTTFYVPFLEAYSKALGNNEYYEQVLRVITMLDNPEIKALRLHGQMWYEIDDEQDLDIAASMFIDDDSQKLAKIQNRFGGYWRYPKLQDFCYLVNPYYPTKKLKDEIKANFDRLICQYPSGMEVNSLLAAKNFSLLKEQIAVGNGAAELIKSLMSLLEGKIGIIQPTFEEYPNRRSLEDVTAFIPQNKAYAYSADDIIKYFSGKPIKSLILINPDNPTGNYICKNDVLRICKWTKDNAIRFVLDESFVDFSDETNGSLIDQHILTDYKNLVVIKSISKSYGIPGLRLGVIASGDLDLISAIKKDVAIWDINSFAEFYMQIAEKYQKDYVNALSIFGDAKGDFLNQLKGIKYLKPFPTQANFVMCEILSPFDAQTLTKELLTKHNILIKDLSHKKGFDGRQYVRIAVKSEENNAVIIAALKDILGQVNV